VKFVPKRVEGEVKRDGRVGLRVKPGCGSLFKF